MRWTTPSGFTYSLGNSLYIPLTSRSNSRTLPQTRGPGFRLPPAVVAALCRVRDAEAGTTRWDPWCKWLDMQDAYQRLPEALEMVASLDDEPQRRPTAIELLHEIAEYNYDQIVLAGEGEPTLRMNLLKEITQALSPKASSIRLVTNGLTTTDPRHLIDWGVTSVSVALASSDPSQYEQWMQPMEKGGYERAVSFIQSAVAVGLEVEVAAVDRDQVSHGNLEAFVAELGVQLPVRWRPYFP